MKFLFATLLFGHIAFSQNTQDTLPEKSIPNIKNQTTTQELNIFFNYESWRNSNVASLDDNILKFLNRWSSIETDYNKTSLNIDINGDGLIDYISYNWSRVTNTSGNIIGNKSYYVILLNSGSLSFKIGYRCVIVHDAVENTYTWYGDCAQIEG